MNDKARTPDSEINRGAIIVLFAVGLIGLFGVIFILCRPSPNRSAGARQVSPALAHAYYMGFPRPSVALAPAVSVLPPELADRKLLDAIRMKEGWKGSREPNTDGEYGPYQITRKWYLDARRAAGVKPGAKGWKWPEIAFDRDKVEFLMVHYWQLHLGPDADDYSKALAHKGGPPSGQDLRNHVYAREVLNIKRAMRHDDSIGSERAIGRDHSTDVERAKRCDDGNVAERAKRTDDSIMDERAITPENNMSRERATSCEYITCVERATPMEHSRSHERATSRDNSIFGERAK